MSNKLLIASDSGKFNSKVVFKNEKNELVRELFRTVKRDEHNDANGINIRYDGNNFNIGDDTLEPTDDNLDLKKSSPLHKMCTLTMIAKALKTTGRKNRGEEVSLMTSMPLMQYFIEERRNEIIECYKGKHEIEADLGEGLEKFEFEITDVFVVYESGGVVVRHSSDLTGKNVILLDAGGLNVTWLTLTNGKADRERSGINNLGSHSLVSKIQEKVYNATGRTISSADTLACLNKEFEFRGQNANEVNTLVKDTFKDVMKDIVSSIYKKVDVTSYEVFFVGGSSTVYREELTQSLDARAYKQSDDPIFDHVVGCFSLLEKKVA